MNMNTAGLNKNKLEHIYIYIYIFEMIYCGESDSMIEICGSLDESNTQHRFQRREILFFILEPKKVLRIKEPNIMPSKPVLSVWFIQPYTYYYHIYIYMYIYGKEIFFHEEYSYLIFFIPKVKKIIYVKKQ